MLARTCQVLGKNKLDMKTAFFPAKTLAHLPADNTEALTVLCGEFQRFDGHARQLPEHHDDYVEALGVLRGFAMARQASLPNFPEIGAQRHENISRITAYFTQLREATRSELAGRHSRNYFEAKTEEYMALFAKAQVYEFSDAEFKRVHVLSNELRDLIRCSSLIGEDHRRRLLRRLEAMQAELHRKTNDIDRFWGFLGEAAITMRKFGQDLQPVSERVMELSRIIMDVILGKEGIKALPELGQMFLPEKRQN
jgi:hypothetical protein